MKRITFPTLAMCLVLSAISSQAASTKYWDNNAATAGAGGPSPTGTWDTTGTKWTTDSTGSSAAITWADGDTAVFSAGSDATGPYTITLPATRTVGGLLVKDGIVTFAGAGAVSLGTSTATVNNGATISFSLVTAVTASSGAALVLDNGTVRITGAGAGSTLWSANSDFRLGPGGGSIDVNNAGIAQYTGANGFTLTAGTTAAAMTKVGLGEYRSQKGTFTKLVVNQGLWRINGTGGLETGFGAVPASYTADAIIVNNNCGIGTSVGITTPSQRGITVASGVGTLVLSAGWTINSVITGPGGIALNGNGFVGTAQTLTLTGANSFQGNTTVNLGTLSVSSDGNLGSVPSSFTPNSITLNGGGLTATASLTLNANRGIQLTASSPIGVTSGTLTYGGTISGSANTFGLTKTGSGTLTLNGANTFGGGVGGDFTITGGSVNFDSSGAAGAGKIVVTPSSAVTLRNSVASSSIPNALTVNPGTSTIDMFATTGNTLIFSGPITGTAVLTRGNGGGAGIVSLGGDNSGWSGGMEHRGGVLELGHKNALGTATFLVTGTKLATTALQSSTTLTGASAVANAVTLSTNLLLGGVNDLELSGPIALGAAGRTLTVTNSTTISGVLSGGAGLSKAGSGTLTLSGSAANTYGGTTTNTAGTLVLSKSAANAVPSDLRISGGTVRLASSQQVADAANVTITGGTFDLQANNETISGLVLTNGSVAGSGTLTATSLDIRSGSASATLAGAGIALNKTSTNTATLSGPSTYDGGTLVSAGTLIVANTTGSATGPGAVTVAAPGTLAGSGIISGTVDMSGTISPGSSPGTLTTASENWNGGGHYLWQINDATNTPGADPGWDLLNISGGLNITAAAANKFTIGVASLSTNVPGLIDGFDAGASNVWLIAQTTEGITNFDANAFHIVQTGFSNDLGGQIFAISIDNDTNLVLTLKTNSAPSLTVPADLTVNELTTLIVTNTAADPDAGTAFTFSLVAPPTGMTINPTTGVITWTPSEAQGPGAYAITVVVSDDAQTPLSATNNFNVTVNEVNSAPSLASIANQTLNELTTLSVTASATDSDIPANTLTYSLDTAPAGMTIDSGTGAMSWTTTEADGPGVYTVKVVATDNGSPSLSTTNTFTVAVNEVNSAPLLTVPANQTVNEQTLLSVSASASDSDIPANTLTFSLTSAPAAMSIDPNTGAISWTPTEADGPAVYAVAVAVTDNGTPALSVTNIFTVTVNELNTAPSLIVPADQTIDELTSLNVSASATDPDLPANALVFSLGAHPSGMTIVPGTGAISWTPSEAQGPSTNVIEVVVTDNGVPPLSTTNAFTVTVREVNVAPSVTVPADQTIDELTSLNVTNTATDADLPANTLTFSLGSHPTGMTITPDTGIITWTPTEAQGPSSNLVEVIVTDDGSPVLSATNTFSVMVNEINSAPLLTVPADQTVNELTALNVSASATDADAPANILTFSLSSAPAGMSIDPNTGAISWTPAEADGPGAYTVAVAVTDDGTPPLSVTNSFTVTVNEVNSAPSLLVPADQTLNELTSLNVSASATDPDLPANTLTFSLGAHPGGMTIVPATGAISWTPAEAQGPSTNVIEVIVADNGAPPLSVTNTFTVTVNEVNVAPSLTVPTDQTIDELTSLNVTNTATDSDLPANTLVFSLGAHPAGMTITPDTGIINWTPTEAQGPSSNLVAVIVTDDGSPVLSTTNTFAVIVNEVNSAPLLTVPANQTINEQNPLSVSASATDSDLPANTVTFSLPSAPAAMTIDPNTGAISWTPSEADGPAIYTVSVAVTDDGTPALSVTNSFTVTVNEVNTAPLLTVPADQTINELVTLNVSASATDSDVPANTLTFSLLAPPAGMSIVPGTGVITWTPTEAQGPSTNVITVVVTDNGTPALSATNSFTVTVNEVNTAPSLPAIANRTIHAGQTLAFTNSATDSDVPANTLTYTLYPGAPATASVGSASGIFTWATTASDANTTNAITVRVTDDGTPALDNAKSFTVTVVSAPTADISVSGNVVTISWTSIAGQTYRVQYKNNIDDAAWTDLAPDVTASGSTASITDTTTSQRFYRVAVLP